MSKSLHVPPLIAATKQGRLDIVEGLLRDGTDVNGADNLEQTALMHAARNSLPDIAARLLKSGADVNAQDTKGRTPLFYAAYAGCSEIVDMLLQENADPNMADEFGRTALMHAAVKGHADIARLLLEKGANSSHKDKSGRTASEWGQLRQGSEWLHLLDGPAPLQTRSRVATFGYVLFFLLGMATVLWLISGVWQDETNTSSTQETTAPPSLPASTDISALADPLRERYKEKGLRLRRGPDGPELVFPGERLPTDVGMITHHLMESCKHCNADRAINCLSKGHINVNVRNAEGRTPISLAAEHNCVQVVSTLLARRADVNAIDNAGRTPVMWACAQKNYEVVDLLLRHGANWNMMIAPCKEHFESSRIKTAKAPAEPIEEPYIHKLLVPSFGPCPPGYPRSLARSLWKSSILVEPPSLKLGDDSGYLGLFLQEDSMYLRH
jgi:ankyrin repeat protein